MHNLPDWFVEKWSDEVTMRKAQRKAKVVSTVANGGMFTGDRLYMPRLGDIEAVDASRLQQLQFQQPPLDWIDVAAAPKFVPLVVWDPDKNKLTIPVVQEMATAVTSATNRAQDDMVITALHTACESGVTGVRGRSSEANAAPATENVITIGDYDTVMTLDTVAEAYSRLGEAEVDVDNEQVSCLIPFKQKVLHALDPIFRKKSDRKDGDPWDDINFVTTQRLRGNGTGGKAAGGTGFDAYVYARTAASTAWNDEVTEINERLGAILGTMFGQWFQAGAAVKEPKAIIRIKAKYDYTLFREALRTYETNPDMEPA
jgi:hypothetical protein